MLRPYGLNQDVCENLEPKCAMASWAYEIKGDLDNAILWLERQVELASWLNANGSDRRDTLLNAGPRMDYLKAARDVTIFAQSNDDPSPFSVGPRTGTGYGAPVDPGQLPLAVEKLQILADSLGGYVHEIHQLRCVDPAPCLQKL